MFQIRLKQLQYESDTWKRVLGFMTDENVHLKNRLSEVLGGKVDTALLMKAEMFQNNFVREDDLIALLRNDIAEFDKLLVKELFADRTAAGHLKAKLKYIRTNIGSAEKEFNKIKHEFNAYLSEYV